MADVSLPLLFPSDGVHHEVIAGSPINFIDQAHNIFVVDSRGESTDKPPTLSYQLLLTGNRLLERIRNSPVAAAADRCFSPAGGLQQCRLTPIYRIVRTRA